MDHSASSILRRMNVQKIRNDVIWDGEERGEPDPRTYEGARLNNLLMGGFDKDY